MLQCRVIFHTQEIRNDFAWNRHATFKLRCHLWKLHTSSFHRMFVVRMKLMLHRAYDQVLFVRELGAIEPIWVGIGGLDSRSVKFSERDKHTAHILLGQRRILGLQTFYNFGHRGGLWIKKWTRPARSSNIRLDTFQGPFRFGRNLRPYTLTQPLVLLK